MDASGKIKPLAKAHPLNVAKEAHVEPKRMPKCEKHVPFKRLPKRRYRELGNGYYRLYEINADARAPVRVGPNNWQRMVTGRAIGRTGAI